MCARAPYYHSLLRTVRELLRHRSWAAQLLAEPLPGGHTLRSVLAALATPASQFVKVRMHACVLVALATPASQFVKVCMHACVLVALFPCVPAPATVPANSCDCDIAPACVCQPCTYCTANWMHACTRTAANWMHTPTRTAASGMHTRAHAHLHTDKYMRTYAHTCMHPRIHALTSAANTSRADKARGGGGGTAEVCCAAGWCREHECWRQASTCQPCAAAHGARCGAHVRKCIQCGPQDR